MKSRACLLVRKFIVIIGQNPVPFPQAWLPQISKIQAQIFYFWDLRFFVEFEFDKSMEICRDY